MGKRHQLEEINILTSDARINDNAPEHYRGLSREDARTKIVSDMQELGLVAAIDDHKLMVPRGDLWRNHRTDADRSMVCGDCTPG